jgi:hypothetical protein
MGTTEARRHKVLEGDAFDSVFDEGDVEVD